MNINKTKIITLAMAIIASAGLINPVQAEVTTENANIGVEASQLENFTINDNTSSVNVELGVGSVSDTTSNTIDKSSLTQESQDNTIKSTDNIDTNLSVEKVSNFNADNLLSSSQFNKLYGSNRIGTAISVSKKGWPMGASTVVIVNAKQTVEGLIATPLAATFDAPILMTYNTSLTVDTINELKRLKPKKVYIIGDENSISTDIENVLKNNIGSSTFRIKASGSSELSANVAEEIKKRPQGRYVIYS